MADHWTKKIMLSKNKCQWSPIDCQLPILDHEEDEEEQRLSCHILNLTNYNHLMADQLIQHC